MRIVSLTLLPRRCLCLLDPENIVIYWLLSAANHTHQHQSMEGGLRGGVCWPCLEHPSLILALDDSFCFSSSNFMHIQSGARCLKTFGDLPRPYKAYACLKYQNRPKNFFSLQAPGSPSHFFLRAAFSGPLRCKSFDSVDPPPIYSGLSGSRFCHFRRKHACNTGIQRAS